MTYHPGMHDSPSAQPEPRLAPVPEWLSWLAGIGWRLLATVGFAAVVIWLLVTLSTTTASVLLAAIVASTFAPYVMTLRGRGWGRAKAAGAVTFAAVLVIAAVLVAIFFALVPHLASAVTGLQDGVAEVRQVLADASIPPEYGAALAEVTADLQAWLTGQATAIAGAVASIVTIAILAGLLTFYLLEDGDKAFAWAVPTRLGWRRRPIRTAAVDAMVRVGGYLRGSTVLGAIYGTTAFAFLWLLGVPLASALGVLVFLGSYIPYVGGFFTTLIILLITLGSVGSEAAIILLILIGVRNVIVANFVRPVVYGRTVDLHPAVILMVLPAGAAVAGVLGMFLAIPVAAFVVSISGAVVTVLDDEAASEPVPESTTGEPAIPVWVDRLGQWSIRLLVAGALIAVGFAIIGFVPLVVVTAAIGIILASTFRPAVRILQRRGWRTGLAAFVVTVGSVALVVVLSIVSITSLVANAPALLETAEGGATAISGAQAVKVLYDQFGVGVIGALAGVIDLIAGFTVTMLLGTLLTFYLLRDGPHGWASIIDHFSGWRRDTIDQAGQSAISVLGNYMISTGALAAFGAITTAVIMFFLGLPLILPIAMLAFILGFIPYLGSLLGTLLAFLVAVKVGTTQDIIVLAVWTLVFNIIQGSFIAPIIYGRAVSLHPAIVLIAIPAGGQLAGVLGMFLGVPILGIVATVWRSVLAVMSDRDTAIEIQGGNGPPGFGSIDPAPPEPASLDTGPPPDPSPG
jgi:predicted PurR-regulated permease PerM